MGIQELCDLKTLSRRRTRRHRVGRATIVMCQNLLLWMSLYVMGSTIYVLVIRAANTQDVPSAVMYLVASTLSLFYLCIQNIATRLRMKARSTIDGERAYGYQALAAHSLPILLTMWMVASGLCITFTAARRPLCALKKVTEALSALDRGDTCIVNRVTTLSGLVAMIAAMLLFLLMRGIEEANRCHLFGIVAKHKLLPLFLAEKQRTLRSMPSEMSFKCRSSTSISTRAVPAHPNAYHPMPPLPPTRSHSKTQNLSSRITRSSAPPSLLPPRSTLTSIRSHASLPLPPPPSSPLPPLPAYLPPRDQTGSTIHKAIHPPRSFSRPRIPPIRPTRSDPAFLCVPTPALSRHNLAVLTGRRNSMSSIYSRDTTGESQIIPRHISSSGLSSLTESSRSCSSASTVTIRRSPMRREVLDIPPPEKSRILKSKMSDTSSEGCDDLYVPSPGHHRTSSDDTDRSVVDSIDIFAPLPLPLRVRKSEIILPGTSQHQQHQHQQHQQQNYGQEDACMNARLNVTERLRRYAESQNQIRRQRQTSLMRISTWKVGGRGTCPERFRFE